jgi:uncharacterized membrane protein
MQVQLMPSTGTVERPPYAWLAAILEVATSVGAIPVGLWFITDPSGKTMGLPAGWIEATPFGTYLVPGIYLFAINGLAMLLLAGLTVRRHWIAPWLTGVLGVGLIVWILVQLAVMPETMFLQWIFLAVGLVLGFIALFWLRRTGQLRLW